MFAAAAAPAAIRCRTAAAAARNDMIPMVAVMPRGDGVAAPTSVAAAAAATMTHSGGVGTRSMH